MWGGIVGRLNASLPSHHPPVGSSAERGALPSPAAGSVKPTQRAVDWGSISAKLNTEAGLTPPARR
jgi:hypothetical protein